MKNRTNKSNTHVIITSSVFTVIETMERRTMMSTAPVSGTIYIDLSGDGSRQSGEPGIAGRTVFVDLNNNGVKDASEPAAITDSSGNYTLNNLPAGAAIIRQIKAAAERQTFPNGGLGQHITVGASPVAQVNFGTTTDTLIAGTVFSDANSDGTQNSGEAGISGVLVYADLNNDSQYQTTEPHLYTSPAGKFTFQNLAGGTYTFRLASVPANQTALPLVITVASGASNLNANIAVQPVPSPATAADSAGNLDMSFGANEGYITTPKQARYSSSSDLTVLPNGQFLLYTGTLQKYNSDGTLDPAFGANGSVNFPGAVFATMIQSTGDIVITGSDVSNNASQPFLERLLPNGKLDTSFGAQHTGVVTVNFGFPSPDEMFTQALLPLPGGQFIVGGTVVPFSDGRFALERFNSDGTVDNSFGPSGNGIVTTDVYPSQSNTLSNSALTGLSLTPAGEILAIGQSSATTPEPFISTIARYTGGGILDTSFGQNGTGIVYTILGEGTWPTAIRSLSSGQFIVAGETIAKFGGGQSSTVYALRYNADGSLDSTYGQTDFQSASHMEEVRAALIFSDGSILFGGDRIDRTTLDSAGPELFRLTSAGAPDTTFNGGSAEAPFDIGDLFLGIGITADQHIVGLIGGYNGETSTPNATFVARFLGGAAVPAGSTLAANGALNVTGSAKSDAITVDLSGDGKSVIATVNGVSKTYALETVKQIHVDALNGDDSVSITSRVSLNSTIYGGEGNDTLSGGSGSDLFYGNNGDDVIRGNAGSDRMYGGNGNDDLDGGLGNDFFYGQSGNDTADYSNRTENLVVHIGYGGQGTKGESDYIALDIETVIGGSGNDTLNANAAPAMLIGGKGNDTLISGHGSATLIGGEGDDLFQTKNNHYDTLDGGAGNNTALTDTFDTVTNIQHRTT